MGHSIQAIAILAKGLQHYFSVPLIARIHEGIQLNCKDNRTLLDKLFKLLLELNLPDACYLVDNKYHCSGRLMKMLVAKGIHIIIMKKNAVAYYPVTDKSTGRGRPKKYGKRVKLFNLFDDDNLNFIQAPFPTYPKIIIEYCVMELLWRPLGDVVKFVLVKHPIRGNAIVMSTDLSLAPLDMIFGYSLRFKIEVLFKQAIHQVGTFMYRFWLKIMVPRKRSNASGDWELHFSPEKFKACVSKKINAYHLFMQLGFIAQGLMQYLSIHHHKEVW